MELDVSVTEQSSVADRLPSIRFRHGPWLIVALGLVIRLALLATPRAYYPDEIFQYLEPAHRLVFGQGMVT